MAGKISILLALYRPNLDWLKEQLLSIELQTYGELELILQDDCPENPVDLNMITEVLQRVPFSYERNSLNLGTAKTFERLIERANGTYIAFCDQDDCWESTKLEQLEADIRRANAAMAYCNLSVINASGLAVADSVKKVRKRQMFLAGESIGKELIVKCSIYGCTMLMKAEIAKAALPIGAGFGHDHWMALYAAVCGGIFYEPKSLVHYRLHGTNQSTSFKAITNKKDYFEQRIINLQIRLDACQRILVLQPELADCLADLIIWCKARNNWFHRQLNALPDLLKGVKYSKYAVCFELLLPYVPECLFRVLLALLQQEKI